MGKKKASKKEDTTMAPSNVLRAMVGANRKKFNSTRTLVGDEMKDKVVGIPWPCLALMWLTESTVMPLGKLIGLAGESQSQKSTLGFEMMGWMMRHGAVARLLENEGAKWSDTLIRSLIGPYVEKNQFGIDECSNIGQVQQMTTSTLEFLKKNEYTKQLTGIMVDSLVGTTTEERATKIVKDGEAGRAFADGALSWTAYMAWLSGRLIGWPIIWLFINHLKDKQSDGGKPGGKTTPGGKAQRFYSALYFWVRRTGRSERATWEVDGKLISCPMTIRSINIHCEKNSYGVDGRKMNVDFCWWFDQENQQRSFFNWDAMTVDLLVDKQKERGFVRNAEGFGPLSEICHITQGRGAAGNTFSCKQVGVEKVMAHTLGAAIHANAELMEKLIDFFHIHRRPVWDGKMLEEPKEEKELPPPEGGDHGPEDDPDVG